MIGLYMCITIQTLWKQGKSKSEIARITRHNWRTINKAVKALEEGKLQPERKKRQSLLDPYQEKILEYLEQNLSSVRIHEKLKAEGCLATYATVKKHVARIKKRENICIRFHSDPGEEAQVDFGYLGKTIDDQGKLKKTWAFNMRLSYSRLDYFEKVYDQSVEAFIQCHINAFYYFQGVPKSIKIDNLKAAILEANFYEPIYQLQYKQFADHYGFDPIPCRVRKPQEKGKTESGIKYIKNNFLAGRSFRNGADLDKQIKEWLEEKCNARVHGTTRKIPRKLFEEREKEELQPIREESFEIASHKKRKVYRDCHVYLDYNYYSVPYEYVGKEVEVKKEKELVRIYYQNKEIALHPRATGKGKFTTTPSHYPKYKNTTSTEYRKKYLKRMEEVGEEAVQYFFHLLEKDPKSWHKPVKGILSLVKFYSNEVVNLSCKRALHFQASSYRMVKSICENGSYKLPLENGGVR